jgi:hypothetical protein
VRSGFSGSSVYREQCNVVYQCDYIGTRATSGVPSQVMVMHARLGQVIATFACQVDGYSPTACASPPPSEIYAMVYAT